MDERECTRLVRERALNAGAQGLEGWLEFAEPPCETCGRRLGAERHHRKFRSRGGVWLPSNVLLLCGDCHRLATEERHPFPGVNVHSWELPPRVPVRLWWSNKLVLLDDEGGFDFFRPGGDNAGHGTRCG